MAWGTPAGKRVQKIDKQRHLVLQSVHPSPLSASRGFFDCGHFKKANEWLISRYGEAGEIDWALAEGNSTLSKPAAAATKPAEDEKENIQKKPEEDELDADSDDEEALEEALKLAEEEAKK